MVNHSSGGKEALGKVLFDPQRVELRQNSSGVPTGSSAPAVCQRCSALTSGSTDPRMVAPLCPFSALRIKVGWRHFQEALQNLKPSVPAEDLLRYEQLAAEYQNTKT